MAYQGTGPSQVPPHVPVGLVYPLDHLRSAEVLADPIGFMDPLRERFRIFYSPAYEGFWVPTRYADIRDVFLSPHRFASQAVGVPAGPATPDRRSLRSPFPRPSTADSGGWPGRAWPRGRRKTGPATSGGWPGN